MGSDVRGAAANALGNMGEAGAAHADAVAGLLGDDDSGVRSAAADALGNMGEAGAAYAGAIAELPLQAGDKVEANYKGKGKWYRGKVDRANSDGTYDIKYD